MKKTNFKKIGLNSAIVSTFAVMLTGCVAPVGLVEQNKTQTGSVLSQVAQSAPGATMLPVASNTPGTPEYANQLSARPAAVARKASRPWIGARMVEVQSDENLPPIFYKAQNFNFADPKGKVKRVPLRVVAERITAITGIPIRISIAQPANSLAKPGVPVASAQPLTTTPMPSPLPPQGVAAMPSNLALPEPMM